LVPAVSHARSTILPERSVASVSRWCPRPGYSRFWARFLSDRTHTLPSPSGLRVPSSSPPCKVVVRRRIECAAWLSIVGRRIASLSTTCKNLEGKDTDTRTVSPVDRFSGIASLAGNLPPRGARGRNSLGVETRSTRFRAPSGESPLAGSSTRSDRGFRARDVERPEPRSEQRREGHERLSAATTARRPRGSTERAGRRTPAHHRVSMGAGSIARSVGRRRERLLRRDRASRGADTADWRDPLRVDAVSHPGGERLSFARTVPASAASRDTHQLIYIFLRARDPLVSPLSLTLHSSVHRSVIRLLEQMLCNASRRTRYQWIRQREEMFIMTFERMDIAWNGQKRERKVEKSIRCPLYKGRLSLASNAF
jgi:hypothetical protein